MYTNSLRFTKNILWYLKKINTTNNIKSNNIQAKIYVKTSNIQENNVHEKVTIYKKNAYIIKTDQNKRILVARPAHKFPPSIPFPP